jgi:dynein heavy chain
MIDPQGQANRWVKKMGVDKNIAIIKLSESTFLRTLENAIRYGAAVLLENVMEVLDPALEPILLKAIVKKGGQLILRLGSEDVPYSEEFSFYITTKMPNPHYLPEICIKVAVINFTVTMDGLVDQLVGDVVAHELPELDASRQQLVVQIAADKAELDRIEALILQLLAESSGDILADDTLIVTLDQSGETTTAVGERMKAAEATMTQVAQARETYWCCAERASILYFVVADMGNIDPMYQWSLEYFTNLFKMRMDKSEPSDDLAVRVQTIIDDMTLNTYIDICRGLFEDHKLIFSSLIACNVLRHENKVSPDEWLYFLRGFEAAKLTVPADYEWPEGPAFLPHAIWNGMVSLEEMTSRGGSDAFVGLQKFVLDNGKQWEDYFNDNYMVSSQMPCGLQKSLTPFQRLLVIRTLRENFTIFGMREVVREGLGETFTASPPADITGAFSSSMAGTPIILVLSAGADPTAALLKLAKDRGYDERLHILSLGQGQGPKAEKLLTLGRETGDWVCLQNCHLAASWMPALERLQELQKIDQIDPDYRLWLTSMPSKTFPTPVLQSGVKMTNEPPKGLKFNMARTYANITDDRYEACTKPAPFKKMLFALAFFHAVILERRKFGPVGWNIGYEWMDSDFNVSMEQLLLYLDSQPGVPYGTLRYIVAEVNYGGRVTDDKDVRLISAILAKYFTEEVLTDYYRLSSLDEYYAPVAGPLEDTKEFIRKLPTDENPEVFGLHPNALITAQTKQARTFQGTVVSVQPRIAGSGGGKTPEQLVSEMANDFLDRLPKMPSTKQAHAKTFEKTPDGGVVSLGVFFGQEFDQFSALVKQVIATLKMLDKAVKGLVVMSAELEQMFNAFNLQAVPGLWVKRAYPCLKPLNSWYADFLKRLGMINSWMLEGPPVTFWVPAFFFPQGFMTASLQVYARHTQIAIDTLAFRTVVTKMEDEPNCEEMAESGNYMHGLYYEGCGFDKKNTNMVESDPRVLYVLCPVIWLKPMLKTEIATATAQDYRCPLYKTSERKGTLSTTGHSTNFVLWTTMPTDKEDTNHWVRRGVCLLCMLDE